MHPSLLMQQCYICTLLFFILDFLSFYYCFSYACMNYSILWEDVKKTLLLSCCFYCLMRVSPTFLPWQKGNIKQKLSLSRLTSLWWGGSTWNITLLMVIYLREPENETHIVFCIITVMAFMISWPYVHHACK